MLNRNYRGKHHVFSLYNSEPLYKTKVFSENKHMCLFFSQIFLRKNGLKKETVIIKIKKNIYIFFFIKKWNKV